MWLRFPFEEGIAGSAFGCVVSRQPSGEPTSNDRCGGRHAGPVGDSSKGPVQLTSPLPTLLLPALFPGVELEGSPVNVLNPTQSQSLLPRKTKLGQFLISLPLLVYIYYIFILCFRRHTKVLLLF